MSNLLIKPSTLRGSLSIPPSKSETLRAILFGSLGFGETIISNPLNSIDTQAMHQACECIGASFSQKNSLLYVQGISGKILPKTHVIDVINSGICLRFLTALISLQEKKVTITGDASLKRRPMHELTNALRQLGVKITFLEKEGFAPLSIQGPIQGSQARFKGEDSQPVSALLIAGCFHEKPLTFFVDHPGELPWVDLTLGWLKGFGALIKQNGYEHYLTQPLKKLSGFHYTVPGDWSSAAFPLAASIISGHEVKLKNLSLKEAQGDKSIIGLVQSMGASVHVDESTHSIKIRGGQKISGLSIDVNPIIDALPILAVLGCYAEGETVLYNAYVARHKESDRLSAMTQELNKMGADIEEHKESLVIRHSKLRGAKVCSHGDQRIAMALSVAALGANGTTIIEGVECLSKTYPTFIEDLKVLGAHVEKISKI